MQKVFYILSFLLLAVSNSSAQTIGNNLSEIVKVEAPSAKGFGYPYYLYVPKAMRENNNAKKKYTLLVIPNNSGKLSDDLSVQEDDAKRRILNDGKWFDQLEVAVLIPVFPRSQTNWKIYTHALDRDVMTTDKKEFSRFDLQLIRMIDDARTKLAKEKLKFDKRVFITGFSASGMFANRFTFLHPKRVKAVAIGSPGGWAIAPVASYNGKTLRYPIGVNDFKSVSGKKFDLKNLRKVPLFMFLGDKDENDSVPYRDGYEKEDEDLIFILFGKKLVERWKISEQLYLNNKLNAEFRLYPNVKHEITNQMISDIKRFFSKYTE